MISTAEINPFLIIGVALIGYAYYRNLNKKHKGLLREKYFLGRFRFYDMLDEEDRKKFLNRVDSFLEEKQFMSRGKLEITEEMKSLIAGAAIQLTFGLKSFTFDYFSKIIIYPESYYSKITGERHMGEANPMGIVVISWSDFLKGFSIPDDTYNVGLHEMAHALELENRIGQISELFNEQFYRFKQISADEFAKLRNDEDSFLRSYAGTNREEFFAVCVEYFFEKPQEFKAQLPEVYEGLKVLLNQDPLQYMMPVS